MQLDGSTARGPNGEITISWVWKQLRKAIIFSQSWFVVSIAGMLEVFNLMCSWHLIKFSCRSTHRGQRCIDIYYHGMAIRYQNGLL